MEEVDLKRLIGNLFVVGFEGTGLTAELRDLIENHYVGAILLSSKNLTSAAQTLTLVSSLQQCARDAGYARPLLIAIDQENGGMNSLVDESITQFPSSMGTAASTTQNHAKEIAAASASELACLGINWIFGPVLDVLSNTHPSPLGVRAFSDDPLVVLQHGHAFIQGYKEAGVLNCGKHFPSFGEVELADGNELSMPAIPSSIDPSSHRALLPFRAGAKDGLDAILIGGCSLNLSGRHVPYAFLDPHLVTGWLRRSWGFDGVILSDCLGMEALCQDIGISQGAARAINAGCDMILICHSYRAQLGGLAALQLAVANGDISLSDLISSNNRINAMKDRCSTWDPVLTPLNLFQLQELHNRHLQLSKMSYKNSVSLVRDSLGSLDALRELSQDRSVVLLTPLLSLFPSTATRSMSEEPHSHTSAQEPSAGEDIFQDFGKQVAKALQVKLTHASYSSNGIQKIHEKLISASSAVILVTGDATRNTYQYSVTKHVHMQCKYQEYTSGQRTPLIAVAVSSPYDFLSESDIDCYICTYDFTPMSLKTLAALLAGEFQPSGIPPVMRQHAASDEQDEATKYWLVESYDEDRDHTALHEFFLRNHEVPQVDLRVSGQRAFVVRNSSIGTIFGLVVLEISKPTAHGRIVALQVDTDRKNIGIEESLRNQATRFLAKS